MYSIIRLDKYGASTVVWEPCCDTSCVVKQPNIVQNSGGQTGTYNCLYYSKLSGQNIKMMAQDTANNGLMTLNEQSRNSQLKEEAERCKTELLTLRSLFQGSI